METNEQTAEKDAEPDVACSATLGRVGMRCIDALLRDYIDAGIAAGVADYIAGPHADTDPDADKAWERCAHLRTEVGLHIRGLEAEIERLRADNALRPFDALYALRDYAFHAVDCPDSGYAAGGGAGACVCGLDEAWRAAVTLLPPLPACSDQ